MTENKTTIAAALVSPTGELLIRSIGAPDWYAAMLGEAARPRRTADDIFAEGFRVIRVRVEVLDD